ncbi:hypothetical protein IFM89_026373 [Coptis chinensis]|uniref:Uncharacterized protein n=1 Tax=Coptis chinensis TaxID=261450 RepID=A0A835M469_9MAGN|nr:hypothetical protein IFM89_026373 [Coptis chinensis]
MFLLLVLLQIMFQDRIFRCRKAEFSKLQEESICQIRNQNETKRKMLFFLRTEEDRQKKVHEEEEARTRKEVEGKVGKKHLREGLEVRHRPLKDMCRYTCERVVAGATSSLEPDFPSLAGGVGYDRRRLFSEASWSRSSPIARQPTGRGSFG